MDISDLAGWGVPAALSPILLVIGYLTKDNARLRSENAALRSGINSERQTRFDAEERAERAEARVAGLEERIAHLLQVIAPGNVTTNEGGVGHA